jgi:hypothetical protein
VGFIYRPKVRAPVLQDGVHGSGKATHESLPLPKTASGTAEFCREGRYDLRRIAFERPNLIFGQGKDSVHLLTMVNLHTRFPLRGDGHMTAAKCKIALAPNLCSPKRRFRVNEHRRSALESLFRISGYPASA